MFHQQHEHAVDSSQSSTFPFEFQSRATELLPTTPYSDLDTIHGHMVFATQYHHSVFSATAPEPLTPVPRPRYSELTSQQMPCRNVLGSRNIQTRDFYALLEYQSSLESAFEIHSPSEHRLTTTWPTEAMSSYSTQPMDLHHEDEETTLIPSIPLQPARNALSDFLGHAPQEPAMERPINTQADCIPKPVPHRHDSGVSYDIDDGHGTVQDVHGSGPSTPGETIYSAIHDDEYFALNSGAPSIQHQQQHFEHRTFRQEGNMPHQDGSESLQAPYSSPKIGEGSMDGFVNYTLKDKKKLSEGVARSGSLKTRLRRKAKAKEKKSRLVQSFLDAIAGLDPNFDLDAVHGLAPDQNERRDTT